MNKRPFKANHWLNNPLTAERPAILGQNTAESLPEEGFCPTNFLIPEWKGESLISKPALELRKQLFTIVNDAKKQFAALDGLNRSMRQLIYNEFLSFAESKNAQCHELDHFGAFWQHLHHEHSPYKELLEEFSNTYCFRSVVIYLFKIRFITLLSKSIGSELTEDNLLNPASYLTKIFKRQSSTELNCESLQPSQYTWFRPLSERRDIIRNLANQFPHISISEMMKTTTLNKSFQEDLEDGEVMANLAGQDENYAHSLSHKGFGLFLNQLLIKIPIWLGEHKNPFLRSERKDSGIKVLNTKFSGDHLCSLTQSHWLAQENNSYQKWDEILCPDFIGNEEAGGTFIKLCHELQFLCFLLQVAAKQEHDPIKLICQVMRDKYSNSKESMSGQISMFDSQDNEAELLYHRIILNLTELPKTNPHHYLLGQVNQQSNSLSSNGYLYTFSNQKLFVPSQSEKVEQLLKIFKLEAHFNFDHLKGRGKIPNYLYVFSKRSMSSLDKTFLQTIKQVQKESCLTFRYSGDLTRFDKFNHLVSELETFLKTKSASSTPLYQNDLGDELTFEFHQDAIMEGKLLSSTSGDSSKITHPNFFRNLTKSCIPLDQFFQIESISHDESSTHSSDLLGLNQKQDNRYPLVLVVDHSDPRDVKLEIIASSAYKARAEQYGYAFFQYFGLIPKQNNINLNVFREFFSSRLGIQIIQLSLNGGFTKLKSKLKSLLIPKFFRETSELPNHVEAALSFLQSTSRDLLDAHPCRLKDKFSSIEQMALAVGKNHPWQMMGLLSHFKLSLNECLENFEQQLGSNKINYNNPLILEPLLQLESHQVYPKSPEVYLEYLGQTPKDIHLPLSDSQLRMQEDENYCLELYSGNNPILQFHSAPELLSFIRFVLNSAKGSPISSLLQQLQVPRIEDLQTVLHNFSQMQECLTDLLGQVDSLVERTLSNQISSR